MDTAPSLASAKVPEVTATFWLVKILTTGLGETTSDFFVRRFEPLLVIPVAGVALFAALAWQWWTPGFSKWRYWLAVALVAVFGTMVADAIHVVLGMPYAASTAGFAVALVVLFTLWRATERTLSIHSITTPRREAFYWSAVIATFALGTAAGDFTATSLGLGYFWSGVMFLVLFALPLLARHLAGASEVGTFWAAYVLTRPLGASFADWIGVPPGRGGLDLGTGLVSAVLAALAVAIVAIRAFESAAGPNKEADARRAAL
jgi:uncharacterized membrane-anchored protein